MSAMNDPRDPLLRRAIDELRKLPDVERGAIERVVANAAASRLTAAEDDSFGTPLRRRVSWGWFAAAATAAAAVVATAVLLSSPRRIATPPATLAVASLPGAQVRPVSATSTAAALPVLHQFVFNDRGAHSVSVVGDFNGWNPRSAPMTRSPDGDLWSTSVPVLPGRHTFGYMVDDSVFVLDPRMPMTRDPDLGTEGSVVLVGRP